MTEKFNTNQMEKRALSTKGVKGAHVGEILPLVYPQHIYLPSGFLCNIDTKVYIGLFVPNSLMF